MFQEDLSLFFHDFVTTVSINDKNANVIFFNETVINNEVISNSPYILLEDSQIEELEVNIKDEVVFDDEKIYRIETLEPDSTGLTRVYLSKRK